MNNDFTPPTKYPTRFKLRDGRNATLYALTNENHYIGTIGETNAAARWYLGGVSLSGVSGSDLRDIPCRRTISYPYGMFGVDGNFLVTCNQDGSEPTVIWEEA
jgi:hypothetical protein